MALDTLILHDNKKEYVFNDEVSFFLMFEDSLSEYSLAKIQRTDISNLNQDSNARKKSGKTYWGIIPIRNISTNDKPYVLEFYDQSIDEVELYLPGKEGIYIPHKTGDEKSFSSKEVFHKNFVFRLPHIKDSVYYVYIKLKSSHDLAPIVSIKEDLYFAEYAMQEYYYFGILYGLVFAMAFYNLFVYFAIKDKTYLFYVLYVLSFGLYTMASNGTGFQFIWNEFPEFNSIASSLFRFLLIEFALLYSISFLDVKKSDTIFFYTFIALIFLRVIGFVAEIYTGSYSNLMDALILFAAYFIGIIKWKNGYKPARFFLIGCSVLFIGFILNHFMTVDTKVGFFLTIILVYSVQFSAVIEMMFFSLALSDKVRTITKEREQLKDNLNKELEQKVKERTEELNTFVYRVSHDLKGPLNSITKLTKLGVKDSNNAQEYFDHINKTSVRLEGIVKEFLGISRAKEGKVNISSIDFNALVETILNGLQELDYFKKSSIKIHINQEYDFLFDESLISSIIQNLFENALKYQKSEPYHHQVILGIEVKSDHVIIRLKDNGKGIKKESHQKVFEMFHRESVETQGSGLGLYIIKSIVEKFKGSILLDSEEGIGTSIQIKLPNSSPGAKRKNPSYQKEFVAS